MQDEMTIEALFATNEVYMLVNADTAKAHGVSAQRWHCHINGYNTLGALVHVYSPLSDRAIFLSWAAILSIEAVPSYE
jgi:hypothetical protein